MRLPAMPRYMTESWQAPVKIRPMKIAARKRTGVIPGVPVNVRHLGGLDKAEV